MMEGGFFNPRGYQITGFMPRESLTSSSVKVRGAVQDDEVQEQGRGIHLH